MKTNERIDIYQTVTDKIIAMLENGVIPWRKPWTGSAGMPKNLLSKKPYRGVNLWMLHASGYTSEYWLTYKQAQELGGSVRKGEKSTLVVYWKMLEVERDGEKKKIPMLKYYNVFNVEQCEGVEHPTQDDVVIADFNPLEQCETIVANYPNPPTIEHVQQRAFYSRGDDKVNMPKPETFSRGQEYYSTLFHELVHSTGHESRLGRLQNSVSGFGSTSYAKEELVAEMGAAYLCGLAGIENVTLENSAAYIASWLQRLRDDRKLVISAAAQANKAVDFIISTDSAE